MGPLPRSPAIRLLCPPGVDVAAALAKHRDGATVQAMLEGHALAEAMLELLDQGAEEELLSRRHARLTEVTRRFLDGRCAGEPSNLPSIDHLLAASKVDG